MITVDMADAYFEKHMDKNYWAGLPLETREAVLCMAENDVAAALGFPVNPDVPAQRYAVCEQAVFLSRNHSKQTGGKDIASESLDGVGSRSYHFINTENPGISPRAAAYIKQAKSGALRGSLRVYRG
jgi:hypothetical protein